MQPKIYAKDPTTGIDNALRDREDLISVCVDHFHHDPDAKYKVFIQMEPQNTWQVTPRLIQEHNYYDVILAWDQEVLDKCHNAIPLDFLGLWIHTDTFKSDKKNEISFITSDKAMFDGHLLRQRVYKRIEGIPGIGEFSLNLVRSPPKIPSKNPMFEHAKFAIVIENTSRRNLMSEKLVDALYTKTVPIYWGAPNVGEFFNSKGILSFETEEELYNILSVLTPELYDRLADSGVLEENYERCLKHTSFYQPIDAAIDKHIYCLKNAYNPTDIERGCVPPKA
tara:strand:+ start:600 stop:1442 length:843 start_codon:yes stop_codon:yes gene_type:complete